MSDPFASVAATYDIMVDWPSRLERERPFFTRLFTEQPVQRVLDVGCGTGHHSRMFADMGAEVVGLDPSRPMLDRAYMLTKGDNPNFVEGGFEEIPSLPERFDLIVVLGNTLAYARDDEDLALILRRLREALQPAGRVCIQVVNYDSVLLAETQWLPLVHREVDGREYLFLREYRRRDARVEFTVITLVREHGWARQVERSMHFAVTETAMQQALLLAGFHRFHLYGNYQREPFDPATSPSLVVVAENG